MADNKNKNAKPQSTRLELTAFTADNIVHYLMHAATREDIAELRAESNANTARLDDKIERIADKMDGKFNTLSDKLDKKLNKHLTWLVGLMFGGFTLMVAGLSTIAVMILNVMKVQY